MKLFREIPASLTESLRRHRRVLLLPLVMVAVFLWLRNPDSRGRAQFHFRLGEDAAMVREVDLRFRAAGSDAVIYEISRRFEHGAPADVYQVVRLGKGDYELGVRLSLDSGHQRNLTRVAHIADRPVEVDLR